MSINPQSQTIPSAGSGMRWNWYVVWFYFDGLPEGRIDFTIESEFQSLGGASVTIGQEPSTPPPPPIITPPVTPPTTGPELYEFHLTTNISPELPMFMVERMRSMLLKHGWGLSNISNVGDGYIMYLEKRGSIVLAVVVVLILAILATIKVVVIATTWKRLSDNKTAVVLGSQSVSKIKDIMTLDIPDHEKAELINGVNSVYADQTGAGDTGGAIDDFLGFDIQPVVWAMVAVAAIGASKRK